jgi:hypothetical protein
LLVRNTPQIPENPGFHSRTVTRAFSTSQEPLRCANATQIDSQSEQRTQTLLGCECARRHAQTLPTAGMSASALPKSVNRIRHRIARAMHSLGPDKVRRQNLSSPTRRRHPAGTHPKPAQATQSPLTLRRTIGSGPHSLNLHVARSPTHTGLTKSYAHAPPTTSTGSEAPMRRGVEGRSRTSSRPSDSRRASQPDCTAQRRSAPRAGGDRACRGPVTRSPLAGEHVGRAFDVTPQGAPQNKSARNRLIELSRGRLPGRSGTTYPHFWGQLCGRLVDNPFRSYGSPLYRLFSTVCSVEKSRMRTHI